MCIYPVFAAPTRLHSQNAFTAGTVGDCRAIVTPGYKTRGGQSEIYFLTFLELVSRIRNEGPWVWLDYRQDRCLFSTHIVAPCFLTFSHRVRFKTFEGGFDAPRFLSSELFVGIRVDRVRSAPHPGAR